MINGNGIKIYLLILKILIGVGNDLKFIFFFSVYFVFGMVIGKLVYVNYGRDSDFKYLDVSNVLCIGKIVIVRYGRIFEENKVKVGCFCFSC